MNRQHLIANIAKVITEDANIFSEEGQFGKAEQNALARNRQDEIEQRKKNDIERDMTQQYTVLKLKDRLGHRDQDFANYMVAAWEVWDKVPNVRQDLMDILETELDNH